MNLLKLINNIFNYKDNCDHLTMGSAIVKVNSQTVVENLQGNQRIRFLMFITSAIIKKYNGETSYEAVSHMIELDQWKYVVDYAEKMLQKNPEDTNCQAILQMVRLGEWSQFLDFCSIPDGIYGIIEGLFQMRNTEEWNALKSVVHNELTVKTF